MENQLEYFAKKILNCAHYSRVILVRFYCIFSKFYIFCVLPQLGLNNKKTTQHTKIVPGVQIVKTTRNSICDII